MPKVKYNLGSEITHNGYKVVVDRENNQVTLNNPVINSEDIGPVIAMLQAARKGLPKKG